MQLVTSSNIQAVSYDKATRKLQIRFKSGSVYQWSKFPLYKYNELLESKSKGKYFNTEIKGHYSSKKIKNGKTKKSEIAYSNFKDLFEL